MLIVSKALGIIETLRFVPEDLEEKRYVFEVSRWVNSKIKLMPSVDYVSLYSSFGVLKAVFKVCVKGISAAVLVPNIKELQKPQEYLRDSGDVLEGRNPWEAARKLSREREVGEIVTVYCTCSNTVYQYRKLATVFPSKIKPKECDCFDKLQLVDRYTLP
jgi:hypothetical protein